MNRGIIIKNPDNNTYYTDRWRGWWSKDIDNAKWFTDGGLIELSESVGREENDAFEDVEYFELINIGNFKN